MGKEHLEVAHVLGVMLYGCISDMPLIREHHVLCVGKSEWVTMLEEGFRRGGGSHLVVFPGTRSSWGSCLFPKADGKSLLLNCEAPPLCLVCLAVHALLGGGILGWPFSSPANVLEASFVKTCGCLIGVIEVS